MRRGSRYQSVPQLGICRSVRPSGCDKPAHGVSAKKNRSGRSATVNKERGCKEIASRSFRLATGLVQYRGSRVTLIVAEDGDIAAVSRHTIVSSYLFRLVVSAFYEDIGQHLADQPFRRVFIER